MGGILDSINSYSGLLSIAVAVITAGITLVYVIFTYKQMKAAQSSSEAAIQQIKLNNQPCVIYEEINTFGTACFSGSRRQLSVEVNLENVGDSPAISVYTFSKLQLFRLRELDSEVKMYSEPDYIPVIKAGDKVLSHIHYEEDEIDCLVDALRISHADNMKRVELSPTETPFKGAELVLEIYYKNIMGQWFKNVRHTEIAWLIDRNSTVSINDDDYCFSALIPPQTLKPTTEFELQLIAPRFALSDIKPIEEKEVLEMLRPYQEERGILLTK